MIDGPQLLTLFEKAIQQVPSKSLATLIKRAPNTILDKQMAIVEDNKGC